MASATCACPPALRFTVLGSPILSIVPSTLSSFVIPVLSWFILVISQIFHVQIISVLISNFVCINNVHTSFFMCNTSRYHVIRHTPVSIDSDKAGVIAKEFFQFNYSTFNIENTTLQNGTWLVKGNVTTFGKQSSRILTIDSKTGSIISCE